MSFVKLQIEATIEAPIAKVWSFWTQPNCIIHWNFAADTWCCPRASNDLKVGGQYSARMEAKDGSFGFDFEAVYDQIIEFKKLSYNMADGRNAMTTFESLGEKTKVMTVFDAEKMNPEQMQKDGWQSILNNFKKYVEANK